MSKETISKIEEQIQKCETLGQEQKSRILELIKALSTEIEILEKTHSECAKSVVSHTATSVIEVTRNETDSELLKHSLEGLSLAVRRFEVSHPNLVDVINNIGRTLSSYGI